MERRMCDIVPGDCFMRPECRDKTAIYMYIYDGDESHALNLETGELLESTTEIVTLVEARLQYTPVYEEE